VAEGRVHQSGADAGAHLTSGNVDELLAAATHRTRVDLEQLLAQRFPRPDLPERLQAIPSSPPTPIRMAAQPAPGLVAQLAPERVASSAPRARTMPLAPKPVGLQVTLDQETRDLLQYARALMSHQNPAGEIVPVLKSALKFLASHVEKQKFAATTRPGHSRPHGTDTRQIPAAVKRAVWQRDGGRRTFIGDSGQRRPARTRLEFDHEVPVAPGAEATTESIRLRCRGHKLEAASHA